MKCPKCGYISFDFNDACPRCNRDLTEERARLNLPPFRPDPPLLIGALIGKSNESGEGFRLKTPAARPGIEGPARETQGFGAEDSQAIEDLELAFKDSQAVDFQLEAVADKQEGLAAPEDAPPLHGESLKLDLEDLVIEDEYPPAEASTGPEVASEEPLFPPEARPEPAAPEPSPSEEDLDIDIEDLVIDELPLEPTLSETVPEPELYEKTIVMKEKVPEAGPSVKELREEMVPPAREPETRAPARAEVFFDLEDIKEDEIASIRLTPPGDRERPRKEAPEEEPKAPPETPSPSPGKPVVSEELKLDWEEFNLDFDTNGQKPAKK